MKTTIKTSHLLLSFLGTLLIVIYIPITSTISYPSFLPFPTEAPDTVSMVINDVLGSALEFDLFPDILGYGILIILCILLGKVFGQHRFFAPLFYLFLAAISHILYTMLPFYLNGNYRFRLGYFCYFIALILKNVALYLFLKQFVKLSECTSNHSVNNLTHIFLMTACLCGAVREILFFYQLIISSLIYYGAQIILLAYTLYRLWKHKKYIGATISTGEND